MRCASRPGLSALGALVLAGCLLAVLAAPAAADLSFRAADRTLVYLPPLAQVHGVVMDTTGGGDLSFSDALADIDVDASVLGPCPTVLAREVVCTAGEVRRVEMVLGDSGDTLLNNTSVGMFACGGEGDDVLRGGSGRDQMAGGPGRDELFGGGGVDALAVDLELGVCFGGGAVDGELLDGGDALDLLFGGAGADVIVGGSGDDDAHGFGGDDRLIGGPGRDLLAGLDGDDELEAGDGDDFLAGGAGDDRMDAGAGDDQVGVTVRMDGNAGLSGTPPLLVVETGDDVLDGGDGDDKLVAGPGSHVMDFLDPLSSVEGGIIDRALESPELNGADVVRGGAGTDEVSYLNRALPVRVTPDGLPDDGSPGERDRVEADVERITGGAGDDVLLAAPTGSDIVGENGDDTLVGGAGRDTLRGGGADVGADALIGLAGDDDLAGGPGPDRLDGGPGSDGLAGGDGEDELSGGDGADGLEGGTGSDRLDGGAGDDCLEGFVVGPGESMPTGCPVGIGEAAAAGADGDDVLAGGPGFDRLEGGGGEDIADASQATGPVLIALAGVDPARVARQSAIADRDQLAADVEGARGGRWADTILGNAGDNLLDGGPGADLVDGGGGSDRLRGGPGGDVITSRDGEPDELRCGPGDDVAAADADDDLIALRADVCELVDGAEPGLVRVLASPACPATVRLPGIARRFRLEAATIVPWRSRVEPQACGVRLRPAGARRPVEVSGDAFSIRRGPGAEPRLALVGGRACAGRSRAVLRRLAVSTTVPVLVRGRAATMRASRARWATIDRCDGTVVDVRRGSVRVAGRELRAPARRLLRLP